MYNTSSLCLHKYTLNLAFDENDICDISFISRPFGIKSCFLFLISTKIEIFFPIRFHGSLLFHQMKPRHLQSIYHCLCGISSAAVWEAKVKTAVKTHSVRAAVWLHLQGAGVEDSGLPSRVWRQIVCLFSSVSAHTTPPTQHPQQAILLIWDPSHRDELRLVCRGEGGGGCVRRDGRGGVFRFHQRGQALSESLLLPRSLSVIHHQWWMGNGEAIAFSFTALYHFW